MPRWLSLVERVTRNLVVVGSIPTRGFFVTVVYTIPDNNYWNFDENIGKEFN